MKNDADKLLRSVSQHDDDDDDDDDDNGQAKCLSDQTRPRSRQQHHKQQQHQYSSSCSSLTSGIGQSDQSINNDSSKLSSSSTNNNNHHHHTTDLTDLAADEPLSSNSTCAITATATNLTNTNPKLKSDIKKFVDSIFTDSQSISLEKKAEFGKLVRSPEARLLFALFVDDYRVNGKRVDELTFYSLAQYFSIVLLECLLAEDFRPAKIIMNMMFTYYHEQNYDKIPINDRPTQDDSDSITTTEQDCEGQPKIVRTYLYTLLKDQQIFKSIRFWTSAFYESVIIERNNHPVFVDRELGGKLSNERRNEELDCSKNITFGLLGSFIHNMGLLDLDHEFCQEFLDKHSTIADLSDEHLEMLRDNLKTMFSETSDKSSLLPASTSDKLATFLHKLSNRLNHTSSST